MPPTRPNEGLQVYIYAQLGFIFFPPPLSSHSPPPPPLLIGAAVELPILHRPLPLLSAPPSPLLPCAGDGICRRAEGGTRAWNGRARDPLAARGIQSPRV